MKERVEEVKQKIKSDRKYQIGAIIILFIVIMIISNSLKKKNDILNQKSIKPQVMEAGLIIKFPENIPGLEIIKTAKIEKGSDFMTVGAPARVIASITRSVSSGSKVVLFESADVNTLYADYLRSRNSATRTAKNLDRLRDMYKNQIATEKDIVEAETEFSNSRAELAEKESQLRNLGFNPTELEKVNIDTIWLICDVPESDLREVEKGKKVRIHFTSYPDQEYKGVSESTGDAVDPNTRTVKVRISMPNDKNRFKPGMFAHVEFKDTISESFVIPFTSVFTLGDNSYVFVQKEPGEFMRKEVKLGNSDMTMVEIKEGLEWGEDIVVSGTILLKGLSVGY